MNNTNAMNAAREFFNNEGKREKKFGKNVTVMRDENSVYLKLHNSVIAKREKNSLAVSITLAGWNTPTTRRYCNAVRNRVTTIGVGFHQKNFGAYYNGKEIDSSEWIIVQP